MKILIFLLGLFVLFVISGCGGSDVLYEIQRPYIDDSNMLEGHTYFFTFVNKNDVSGECYVDLDFIVDSETISSERSSLGVLAPGEQIHHGIPFEMPSGDSKIVLKPGCDWV